MTINLAYSSSLALQVAQDSSSRLLAVNMFCFAKLSILSKIFDMNFLIKSTDFASVSGIMMIKTIPLRSRYCASFPRSALCMLLMCDLRWIPLISVARVLKDQILSMDLLQGVVHGLGIRCTSETVAEITFALRSSLHKIW